MGQRGDGGSVLRRATLHAQSIAHAARTSALAQDGSGVALPRSADAQHGLQRVLPPPETPASASKVRTCVVGGDWSGSRGGCGCCAAVRGVARFGWLEAKRGRPDGSHAQAGAIAAIGFKRATLHAQSIAHAVRASALAQDGSGVALPCAADAQDGLHYCVLPPDIATDGSGTDAASEGSTMDRYGRAWIVAIGALLTSRSLASCLSGVADRGSCLSAPTCHATVRSREGNVVADSSHFLLRLSAHARVQRCRWVRH